MLINSKTKILGIIGKPLKHSFSPIIHNNWIKKYKLNYIYLSFPMSHLDDLNKLIKAHNIVGLNITLPYKQLVLESVDQLDEATETIEAANTIHFKNDKILAFNTDIAGISKSIGHQIDNKTSLLILGAGGAAQAMAYLAKQKNAIVDIYNRSQSKADNLAQKFDFKSISFDQIYAKKYDLIVNTTSVGLNPNESPINLKNLAYKPDFVYDMIYNPKQTKLLFEAEQLNIKNMNGLSMLINQAKESFYIWTGIFPE